MQEPAATPQETLARLAGHDPERSTGPVSHPTEPTVPVDTAQQPSIDSAEPSAPNPTHALPTTPESVTPSALRGTASARKFLRRMVQGETPPTVGMPVVERLAGSPYAMAIPRSRPEDTASTPYEGARKTLDLALNLAEVMYRYGAGALEVETSMIAVTAAYGLRDIDVDITNQCVQLNYSPPGQVPMTVMRVVRSWTNNYAGLVLVHDLVTKIVNGGVTRTDAVAELRAITRRPKPFPKWMVTAAGALFSGSIVLLIGGHMPEAFMTTFATLISGFVVRQFVKWRVPDFYSTVASAFTVTAVAMGAYSISNQFDPSLAVAGGIVLLLPAGRTVGAVQDAINGFPVTAAGRLLSAILTFGAIVVGIAVAVAIAMISGVGKLDVTQQVTPYLSPVAIGVLVLVAAVLIGVNEQTQIRLLLPTAIVAVFGFVAYLVFQRMGFGLRLTPALAAVIVGFGARIVALRMGAPQLVVAVPAVLYLLPGLSIFRAMYTLSIEESTYNGIAGLAGAFMIILGIAGGTVAGDNLARPFTRSTQGAVQQRRGRRR
jgi:uncharacterized membrane protein YjjP (DUF1212 family)